MGIFPFLKATWRLFKAIRAEKKKLEANAQAYLSPERAKALRLWLEKMFLALEQGEVNPNFARLPKVVRWFCAGTEVDRHIGRFGQHTLKSEKLALGSHLLQSDIDNWQGPAGDRAKP